MSFGNSKIQWSLSVALVTVCWKSTHILIWVFLRHYNYRACQLLCVTFNKIPDFIIIILSFGKIFLTLGYRQKGISYALWNTGLVPSVILNSVLKFFIKDFCLFSSTPEYVTLIWFITLILFYSTLYYLNLHQQSSIHLKLS